MKAQVLLLLVLYWNNSLIQAKPTTLTGQLESLWNYFSGDVQAESHIRTRRQAQISCSREYKKGTITSPGWNGVDKYEPNLEVCWELRVSARRHVGLEFTFFDLESNSRCQYDNVKIYDGEYVAGDDANLLASLCGKNIPEDFRSTGTKMTVVFFSDHTSQRKGFQAHFRTIRQSDPFESLYNGEDGNEGNSNEGSDEGSNEGGNESSNGDSIESGNEDGSNEDGNEGTSNESSNESSNEGSNEGIDESANEGNSNEGNSNEGNSNEGNSNEGNSNEGNSEGGNEENSNEGGNEGNSNEGSDEGGNEGNSNEGINDEGEEGSDEGDTGSVDSSELTCDYEIIRDEGTLTSPGYDGSSKYDNNVDVCWKIKAPRGMQVVLHFNTFEVEYQSSCNYDSVTVYDESNPNPNFLIDKFCGTSGTPDDIESTSRYLFVQFTTDYTGTKKGFSADISFIGTQVASPPSSEEEGEEGDEGDGGEGSNEGQHGEGSDGGEGGEGSDEGEGGEGSDEGQDGEGGEGGSEGPEGPEGSESSDESSDENENEVTSENSLGCTLVEDGETLQSPRYDGVAQYYKDINACWLVTAQEGQQVKLDFAEFSVEQEPNCQWDSVSVFDGPAFNFEQGSVLSVLCGTTIPTPIQSNSNIMLIVFTTDAFKAPVPNTGFQATITFTGTPINDDGEDNGEDDGEDDGEDNGEDDGEGSFDSDELACDYTKIAEEGTFTTPGYDGSTEYDNYLDVCWKIKAPKGQQVVLHFNDFEIESHSSCNYDAVSIFGVRSPDPNNLIGTYCGTRQRDIPQDIESTGRYLFVQFTSDNTQGKKGFSADVTFIGTPLPNSSEEGPEGPDSGEGLEGPESGAGSEGPEGPEGPENPDDEGSDGGEVSEGPEGPDGDESPEDNAGSEGPEGPDDNEGSEGPEGDDSSDGGEINCSSIRNEETITSPGYDGRSKYDNDISVCWIIRAPSGKVVNINFNSFDVERGTNCKYDVLTLHDGRDSDDDVIDSLCGTSTPADIQSASRYMYITFTTDYTGRKKGFSADITFVNGNSEGSTEGDNEGNGEEGSNEGGNENNHGGENAEGADGNEGNSAEGVESTDCTEVSRDGTIISSPGFGGGAKYANDINVCWVVRASRNRVVELTFTHFEIESQSSCNYDSLTVYDSSDSSSGLIDAFCGSSAPSPIRSTGRDMYVVFTSDYTGRKTGFQAEVKFEN